MFSIPCTFYLLLTSGIRSSQPCFYSSVDNNNKPKCTCWTLICLYNHHIWHSRPACKTQGWNCWNRCTGNYEIWAPKISMMVHNHLNACFNIQKWLSHRYNMNLGRIICQKTSTSLQYPWAGTPWREHHGPHQDVLLEILTLMLNHRTTCTFVLWLLFFIRFFKPYLV